MRRAKKSLGQNFLIDQNIIKKIINSIDIFNKDVLEIGPGKGALTVEILKRKPKSLTLIEKDRLISNELKLKYKKNKIVKIYNEDILEFNIEKNLKNNTVMFGNLPYNISSQILVKIIRFKQLPPKIFGLVFMFQKEMAERIIGKFNTSSYGRLSILTSSRLSVFKKFNVSSNCFSPKPKVKSTVICLKPIKKKIHRIKNIENLEKITNILFSNRRKMINKNIIKLFRNDKKNSIFKDLDLKKRPSDIEPEKYYEITELYERL
ncbi:MAG: 16S rRNA (adenine(1518)-N(6)/adenine(1519)-N(6))-dimethyltransferase RsmA [Candidatus Pelagibacter sp.]